MPSICPLLNISQCPPLDALESDGTLRLEIYNPLARAVQYTTRLPIGDHIYLVEGEDGEVVMTEKLPLPTEVFSIPGRKSSATHTLSFLATLPPMSWVTYGLTQIEESNLEKEPADIFFSRDTKE